MQNDNIKKRAAVAADRRVHVLQQRLDWSEDEMGLLHSPLQGLQGTVVLLKNKHGKTIAFYNNYTFNSKNRNMSTINWVCTRRPSCRAAVTTTTAGTILRVQPEHNHPPSPFVIRNGMYIKI
ncbi:FLYWCH zinc finger domain-containing protein [Phthorimaea operculella]|nr:FLYWCH zinc finger domain-containing protein [Phthorimaea operculella]